MGGFCPTVSDSMGLLSGGGGLLSEGLWSGGLMSGGLMSVSPPGLDICKNFAGPAALAAVCGLHVLPV